MTYETITYERQGPIGVLTLNRPDKLNAIDQTMVKEILQAQPEHLELSSADPLDGLAVFCPGDRRFLLGSRTLQRILPQNQHSRCKQANAL